MPASASTCRAPALSFSALSINALKRQLLGLNGAIERIAVSVRSRPLESDKVFECILVQMKSFATQHKNLAAGNLVVGRNRELVL